MARVSFWLKYLSSVVKCAFRTVVHKVAAIHLPMQPPETSGAQNEQ